jgi:hypothetical protein
MPTEFRFDDLDLREEPMSKSAVDTPVTRDEHCTNTAAANCTVSCGTCIQTPCCNNPATYTC